MWVNGRLMGGVRVSLRPEPCLSQVAAPPAPCACLSQVAALCLRPVPACGLQAYKFVDSIAKILDFWQYCQHSEEEV